MAQQPYYAIPKFDGIYLEDSYVLEMVESRGSIQFRVEAALTPKHPEYKDPIKGEQYCYKKLWIRFPNVKTADWKSRIFKRIPGFEGEEADYGNIDEFYVESNAYHLAGEWGEVDIVSDQPELISIV